MVDLDEINKVYLEIELKAKYINDNFTLMLFKAYKCKECGTQNPIRAKICERCGSLIKGILGTGFLANWRKMLFELIDSYDIIPDTIKETTKLEFMKKFFDDWCGDDKINR